MKAAAWLQNQQMSRSLEVEQWSNLLADAGESLKRNWL